MEIRQTTHPPRRTKPCARPRSRTLALCALLFLLAVLAAVLLLRKDPLPYEPVDGATVAAAVEANGSLSADRQTVVDAALSLVGQVRYFWGGKSGAIGVDPAWGQMAVVESAGSETTGTERPMGLDCSGYTSWCFIQTGMTFAEMEERFGNGTYHQWSKSDAVSWSELQPGDLVFQYDPGAGKGNHVGIVVGFLPSGEPLIAHCAAGFNDVVVTGRGDVFRYPRRPQCYGE